MSLDDFRATLTDAAPPAGIGRPLEGLWWDGRGDWDAAHDAANDAADPEGAWVHAYLHRKEGDHSNAGYWYRRAGREPATGSLEDEWADITAALLARA